MAPRGQALPQAATESAREARKSFFCELCGKGYARMNDFEAHEGSYDHQHRKRMKEMKQLTKDPNAGEKARQADARRDQNANLKSLALPDPSTAGGGGGVKKKKPVFKSTLQPQNASVVPAAKPLDVGNLGGGIGKGGEAYDLNGAIANGWASEQYDPENVTEYEANCGPGDLISAEI